MGNAWLWRKRTIQPAKTVAPDPLRAALDAGKPEDAAAALKAAQPVIDSMVNKGIIHKNAAARYKSRLAAGAKKAAAAK